MCTTLLNIFLLLFIVQHTMEKLNTINMWADVSHEMVPSTCKVICGVLCVHIKECFELLEWVDILEGGRGWMDDREKVKWVLESVKRCLSVHSAAIIYQMGPLIFLSLSFAKFTLQIIVSSILLCPNVMEMDTSMLSSPSFIHVQVKEAHMKILHQLHRCWVSIHNEGRFNALKGRPSKKSIGLVLCIFIYLF